MTPDPELRLFYNRTTNLVASLDEDIPIDFLIISILEADNSADLQMLRGMIERCIRVLMTTINTESAQAVK